MSDLHEKWSISEVKTTDGETMILDNFGLVAVVTDEGDARQIIADREARTDAPQVPAPTPERRSWPKKGDKMRFLGCNGHAYQLEAAKKTFHPEGIYEVERFDLGDWTSYIHFVGIEGGFNSVMFDWIDAAPPARSAASTVEPVADSYLAERKKVVYQNLAEEGGGTWATYMMMDIEEAFAAPTTSPEPKMLEGQQWLDAWAERRDSSPEPADVKQRALDWCKANIVSAADPSKPADCTTPCNACMTMAHGSPEPDAVREALDSHRKKLDDLRNAHRQKMNRAGDAAENAASEGDMAAVSISSTESERHREAFSALNVAVGIFDALDDDVLAALSRPAHGGWEEALRRIAEASIPDQPASGSLSEYEWAVQHVSMLRRLATKALARNDRVTSQPDTGAKP